MPIYEFICQSCGNEFEQIRAFSDSTMPACAKCGSDQVVRRMGRPAIHFKGSGWYINDSKKSNGDNKASNTQEKSESIGESKTESKTESSTESKSEGKSESKPETKSGTKSESSGGESKSAPSTVAKE